MRKFGKDWDKVKENIYRSSSGKKEYIYMYRVKQLDGMGHPVDTWKRQNDRREAFRTLREAEAHRKKYIDEIMSRTPEREGIPDLHTLSEIFESYITNRGVSLAPNTISKRTGDMNNHVIPHSKNRRIESITVGEVRNLVTQLRGKLSYRTVKSVLATMALVWQYAMEMRIIERTSYLEIFVDRGQRVTVPKKIQGEQQEKKPPIIYTNEQIKSFFAYAKEKGMVYYILLLLCYYGGVRLSEALGLCWSDIDWSTQIITVSRQLIYDKNTNKTYVSTTKSKVNRVFKAPPALLAELEVWHKEQGNKVVRSEQLGNGVSSRDLIVADEEGYLSHSKANHFKERVQRDVCRDFIYHGLRHTVVSNLAGAGVPIKSVADFIGHTDIRTTEGFYLRADESSNDKLIAALQTL